MTRALRQSHGDEKQQHDEAVARLHTEYARLQGRIDAMYLDKLDGRIDAAFFDRKAAEWRAEQDRLLSTIAEHQAANRNYLDEGIQLAELAARAHSLFLSQEPGERRRLLNFLLSSCSWKGGTLTPEWRQPFDLLASLSEATQSRAKGRKSSRIDNWHAIVDTFRTFCLVPPTGMRGLFASVSQLAAAA